MELGERVLLVIQPPARHPNQLRRPGASRISRLLRCALWPGLESQHSPAISLGHSLNPARMLGAADLEHCLSRDIVLRARELVQQARGHVGGQGWGGEEEGGKEEEGAHWRNVSASAISSPRDSAQVQAGTHGSQDQWNRGEPYKVDGVDSSARHRCDQRMQHRPVAGRSRHHGARE